MCLDQMLLTFQVRFDVTLIDDFLQVFLEASVFLLQSFVSTTQAQNCLIQCLYPH